MSENFFAYISRMRYITRWSLMRNSYEENIQEHSHMVAVLAHALAVIRNRYFGGCVDEGAVAVAALYHDASEILTGDLPTPIKYYNPEIRNSYKAIEAVAQDKLLSMLPEELQPDFEPVLKEADAEIGEAVGLYQMRGRAKGGKQRVLCRCKANLSDPFGKFVAGGPLFYGALFAGF